MSYETYDPRRAAVAEAAAAVLSEDAENLLRGAQRSAKGDPLTSALVGLGLAVLAHGATVTQLGDDLAAQLQDVIGALGGTPAAATDDEGQGDEPAAFTASLMAALSTHPAPTARPTLHVVSEKETGR